MMAKLSVVIPVYNEPSLHKLLSKLDIVKKNLAGIGMQSEFIFVDDGSDSKDSLKELIKYKEKNNSVRIIRFARNFGSFHAIKAGFDLVTGDCFAMLAADLQDPPDLLVEMAKKWQNGAKFVICLRGERDDPLSTKLFASLYYKVIRRFAISNFPKSGYDLSLMDKIMLPQLQKASVQVNFRLLAYWMGIQAEEIVYKREKREAGETHWGLGKKINLFVDSLIAFSSWPSRALAVVGVLTTLLSLISLIYVLAFSSISGESMYLALGINLLAILAGLLLMGLGLIAEYLWRIFSIVANKPEVVIEEIY